MADTTGQHMKRVRKENSELDHLRRVRAQNEKFIQYQARRIQVRDEVLRVKDDAFRDVRDLATELQRMILHPENLDAERALAIMNDLIVNSNYALAVGISPNRPRG